MSGVPLSSWTVGSNQSYETSGVVTPPDGNATISWFAVGTATVTPYANLWVFTDGAMSEQVSLVGGNPDFSNATLAALNVPGNAAGLAMAGPGGSLAGAGIVSEVIAYRFLTTPLPPGESFVLWETGFGDAGTPETFNFVAENNVGIPVSPAEWSFQAFDPYTQQASNIVALPSDGSAVTIRPNGSPNPPDAVVIATADVPLSSLTVTATTGIDNTWGLALVDAVAQNSVAPSTIGITSSGAGAGSTGGAPHGPTACFLAGTAILTPRGPVAVEHLAEGDPVVTRFAGVVAVRWLGRRRLTPRRHAAPASVLPFRVLRGAVAPGVPARDLLLSPDHAVFLGGVLIPVRYLANGRTIFQDDGFETVEYWHIELAHHDVLLAEALPVESYLDTGNRAAFENAAGAVMLHPDFGRHVWETAACAPLRGGGGPVDQVRALLLHRAHSSFAGAGQTHAAPDPASAALPHGRRVAKCEPPQQAQRRRQPP